MLEDDIENHRLPVPHMLQAAAERRFHIWRHRVEDGTLEQVTSGVTEEAGIEFAPDGRSFVTSIGSRQSTVWVRDAGGDRQITSEGYGFLPSISPDATKLYYLVGARGARNIVSGELWVADLISGERRRLLPDFLMQHYSISADGQRVVFVGAEEAGRSPVWVAALVGRSVPRRVTAHDASRAFFGTAHEVIFVAEDDGSKAIYRVEEDGGDRGSGSNRRYRGPGDALPDQWRLANAGLPELCGRQRPCCSSPRTDRSPTFSSELVTRRKIRVCQLSSVHLCDSSSAGAGDPAPPGLRAPNRAGCRGFAGSASDPATRSVRRPEPLCLRV